MRTALALLAAAVAVVQFAPDLGSRAIGAGRPLRHGSLPFVLAAGLTTVGLAVTALCVATAGAIAVWHRGAHPARRVWE